MVRVITTFKNISVIRGGQCYQGGENRSTWRKPQTSRKLLINLTTSSIPTLRGIRTYNVSGDRHWVHFHTITTTTASKSQ